jgi:hypothetical protein
LELQAQQQRWERGKEFVGAIIFDAVEATKKTTRAASAGLSTVPLRGKDTFVSNRARMWNASGGPSGGYDQIGGKVSRKESRSKSTPLATDQQRRRTQPTRQRRSPTQQGKRLTGQGRGQTLQGKRPTGQGRGQTGQGKRTYFPQKHFFKFLPLLGTVGIGILPIPARLGYLPSAGTSLLDNKRGVSVARPHGG